MRKLTPVLRVHAAFISGDNSSESCKGRADMNYMWPPFLSSLSAWKKNSFLLPGYGNMAVAADESRLSTDFGASVSSVCARDCVCALVCRVELLDHLRAQLQSHSV